MKNLIRHKEIDTFEVFLEYLMSGFKNLLSEKKGILFYC